MSLPVSFPRNLPILEVPVLNDDFLPLEAFLDEDETELFEVAVISPAAYLEDPEDAVWVANPGPKTPTVRGKYLVFVHPTGSPKPAECVGWLHVY